MPKLYIALYGTGEKGLFHWTLALSEQSHPEDVVKEYQIRDTNDGWQHAHKEATRLRDSASFTCCIELPEILQPDIEFIEQILSDQPSVQGDTELLWIHSAQGRGWTCAQWIIRALDVMVQGGDMDGAGLGYGADDWKAKLYIKVCALGEEAKSNANFNPTGVMQILSLV